MTSAKAISEKELPEPAGLEGTKTGDGSMPFLYILMFLFLFAVTLTKVFGGLLGNALFVFVPTGFRTLSIVALLVLLSMRIIYKSRERERIFRAVRRIFFPWMPFLVYMGIRTEFTYVGIYKFFSFIASTFIPCVIFTVMYVNDRKTFLKFFPGTLLGINLLLVIYAPIVPSNDKLYDLSIWLSRGMAISAILVLANMTMNRFLVLKITTVLVLLSAMVFFGSRGPFLSLIIASVLYFLIGFRYKLLTGPLILYLMFIIVLSFLYVTPVKDVFVSFMTHGNKERVENIGSGRLSKIKPSIGIIKKHPVFGVGLNNWALAYAESMVSDKAYSRFNGKKLYKKDYTAYPHNFILEILAELGSVGMLLFILLFYPFRQLFRVKSVYWYLFVMGILFALTSNDITGNPALFIFNTLLILHWDRGIAGDA